MQTSYYDVVDENDVITGEIASYDTVHSKGLWQRGIHVLIYTPDRQIVMQKRSPNLKYHPNEVEVSVGGGVDAGEKPEEAAVREVQEELGIAIKVGDLHFIGKTKFNHKTKMLIMRTFIYSYSICIPKNQLNIQINPEETSSAFLISERKLRLALRRHRILQVGKIGGTYAYWKYLIDSIN
jgi:8-oxo-dGTP pyrophosphatase MutT (NUDIX family)